MRGFCLLVRVGGDAPQAECVSHTGVSNTKAATLSPTP